MTSFSRLKLPIVTLVCITGIDPIKALLSMFRSISKVEFGAIVLVTTRLTPLNLGKFRIERPFNNNLDSIDAYSYYCIYDLYKHIKTKFCLVVQADSWVLNSDVWDDRFYDYDYIGAPWPLLDDAYIDPFGNHQRVGNGGFSLRSINLLEVPKRTQIDWNPNGSSFYKHMNANSLSEDGNICVHNRHVFENQGCKFAPIEIALNFSKELPVPEYDGRKTFGFHRYR